MEIDLFCILPDDELFARVRENCAVYQERAKVVAPHDGAAVLVAGGPSVRHRISTIRERQRAGQKIFALNGSAKYLNDHGIIPDYQVLLDPQSFLKDYIGRADEYLVASQCHPDVLTFVPRPVLWHVATDHA